MASLNLMLPKEERKAMLLRLYNDDTPLIDHSQQRRNQLAIDGTTGDATNEVPEADAAAESVNGDKAGLADPEAEADEDMEEGGVKLDASMNGEDGKGGVTSSVDANGTHPAGETLSTQDGIKALEQEVEEEGLESKA